MNFLKELLNEAESNEDRLALNLAKKAEDKIDDAKEDGDESVENYLSDLAIELHVPVANRKAVIKKAKEILKIS